MGNKGTLHRLLNDAELQLWNDFKKASEFEHKGNIGTAREASLGRFLKEHLPERYHVSRGAAVDSKGNQTGQIDLMIYDGSSTCPLMSLDDNMGVLLPAEALLATIEVKSVFSGDEATKACRGIKAVHSLQPWRKPWTTSRKGGRDAADGQPRLFTSIFAYKTNLTGDDWAKKEFSRFKVKAIESELSLDRVDRIAILGRGLILPSAGQVAQPADEGVLGLWYFSLINFLDREVARRKEFPWAQYEIRSGRMWRKIDG